MDQLKLPFTDVASRILRRAAVIAREYNSGAVSTEHLLLAFFDVPSLPREIFRGFGLEREQVENLLREMLGAYFTPELETMPVEGDLPSSPLLEVLLEEAQDIALLRNSKKIGSEELFSVLVQDWEGLAARVLSRLGLDPLELEEAMLNSMGEDRFSMEEALAEPETGTGTINQFTRDLTAMAQRNQLEPVIGREKELRRMMQILSRRTKNNPCLIGEPGVGKTAVTEALAQKIAAGDVPPFLKGKRIVSLSIANVVAGTKYRGEFEERMKNILEEFMAHPEIILFIDELHTLIGAGGAEGSLDAANILKPALSRGEIQIIGATTLDEYRKHIEKDSALKRRFQSVLIDEPTLEETEAILRGRAPLFESHHKIKISEEAISAAVKLSRRYLSDRLWPDKALDLLDEACAGARMENNQKKLVLTPAHVAHTLSLWTGVPLEELSREEGIRLTELEQQIHQRVIGQEEAVSSLARAIRRSRAGLRDPRRPIGSFLFLGPTGVGKTELSKALAEALFGDEKALIRIDMSEYMEKHSVSKIIGSPPGYVGFDDGGQLSEQIRRKPYSVVLFDEIEKAHPDVFHILLQILDEGRLTDSKGKIVDFKNTVIIMTSNAGAQQIVEPKTLGFGAAESDSASHERMKSLVMEEVRRLFRPEFINRIDDIIVFRMLNREDIRAILALQLRDIEKRIRENRNILIHLSEEAEAWFVARGYEPKYGARPLKRLLQSELEDKLADEILSARIHDGDQLSIVIEADCPQIRKEGKR